MAQLTAIGSHIPLLMLARRDGPAADTLTALVVAVVVSAALIGLYAVLVWFKVPAWTALAWASTAGYFFWHWNTESALVSIPGWLTSVGLLILVAVGFGLVAQHRVVRIGVLTAAVGFSAALGVLAITNRSNLVVQLPEEAPTHTLQERPDVVLLLLDGYGRSDVLDEYFGFDNSAFLDELRGLGFAVADGATSSYNMTFLSVSSLLNMSRVHTDESAYLRRSDLRTLARSISGENQVVSTFKQAGYRYVHGGLASSLNHCGPTVDICLPNGLFGTPHIDWWTVYPLMGRTPLDDVLFPIEGGPGTIVNLERTDQLRAWEATIIRDPAAPTFSFVHLLLPHPPMAFDRSCALTNDDDLRGPLLNPDTFDPAVSKKRLEAWVDQLICTNAIVEDFLRGLPSETVVVVASDHGPDSSYRANSELPLTGDQVRERFSILLASRFPSGCSGLPPDTQLHEVFAHVFACLSGGSHVSDDERQFFVSGFTGRIHQVDYPAY